MIVLTYLKHDGNYPSSSTYVDFIELAISRVNDKTIVLTGNVFDVERFKSQTNWNKHQKFIDLVREDRIACYQRKPIEDLICFKHDNIILINFDIIENHYMEELIRHKSKKTNIVGVSYDHNFDTLKQFNLEMQSLKDQNFVDDEIAIYMSLKFNSSQLINSGAFDNYRLNRSTKYKEINSIYELKQYLK